MDLITYIYGYFFINLNEDSPKCPGIRDRVIWPHGPMKSQEKYGTDGSRTRHSERRLKFEKHGRIILKWILVK
jgi:hypothetical protein